MGLLTEAEKLELFGMHANHPGRFADAVEAAVLAKLVSGVWCLVENALPADGVSVFAATREGDPEDLEHWTHGVDHAGASGWYDADGELVEGVTHWMPRPGNPNKDQRRGGS